MRYVAIVVLSPRCLRGHSAVQINAFPRAGVFLGVCEGWGVSGVSLSLREHGRVFQSVGLEHEEGPGSGRVARASPDTALPSARLLSTENAGR